MTKHIPSLTKRKYVFRGKVIEVWKGSFWAILEDQTDTSKDDSIVEFDFNIISDRDRKWVQKGALFVFMIRYYEENEKSHSIIRFMKRYWKKEDIEKAKSWAEKMAPIFDL